MPVANTPTSTSTVRTSGAGASSKNNCSGPPRPWSLMAFTESLLALSFSRETPDLIREEPRVGSKPRELASAQVEARHSRPYQFKLFPGQREFISHDDHKVLALR